jgi:hypothetical protein
MVTDQRVSVVERAKQSVASRTVFIRGNRYCRGVLPMERRLPGGKPNVSRCEYNQFGKMMNIEKVRPLSFGSNGVMPLNPLDPDDAALLEEARLWIADGSDERIARFGIHIVEGGAVEPAPIPRYENYKVQALIKRLGDELDLIGADTDDARGFLESVARYELQRDKPRKMVLDAVDELGVAAGVEYGTDEVDED